MFRILMFVLIVFFGILALREVQTEVSIQSQQRAHPTCSSILGYGPTAQSVCDNVTGTRTVPMPRRER